MLNNDFSVQLAQQTIYLMGISFILGSLFTIFILVILDMMRAMRNSSTQDRNEPSELQG